MTLKVVKKTQAPGARHRVNNGESPGTRFARDTHIGGGLRRASMGVLKRSRDSTRKAVPLAIYQWTCPVGIPRGHHDLAH